MKHNYAFTDKGKPVHVNDAFKNVMGMKFYYDQNLTCEMTLKDGNINAKHFAFKIGATLTHNGNIFSPTNINESPAHFNFKMKIVKDEYFKFMNYKIFIKNVKIEFIDKSFRYDLKAELLCGTPCVIEVIRSSKTKQVKQNYLNENQILTFELFIDTNGDQIFSEFNLYGNSELEKLIRTRIEFKSTINRLQNNLYYRKEQIKREVLSDVDGRREHLEEEIRSIRSDILQFERKTFDTPTSGIIKFNEVKKFIGICRELKSKISKDNGEIKGSEFIFTEIERIEQAILRTSNEIRQREFEFEQTSQRCRIEWYTPKWVKPVNTLSNFKYWTS